MICTFVALFLLFMFAIFWIANSDGQTRKPNGEWS